MSGSGTRAAKRRQATVRGASWSFELVLLLLMIGCAPVGDQPEPKGEETVTPEAEIGEMGGQVATEEAALREADAEWLEAFEAQDIDRMVYFYAEDAAVFPPNAPVVSGREAIRGLWEELAANPGFELTWEVVKMEMAASGDLAWVQETYEFRLQDPDGQLQEDRGKAVLVWKKQSDGSWKAVADIFNSDLPLGGGRE